MERRDRATYILLKSEFRNPKFRETFKENLGNACVNCGSTGDIEYHHIVPLSFCGTNALSNIVPLCYTCHKVVHGTRNIRQLCKPENTGRPRKQLPADSKETILLFMQGKITRATCYEKLGLTGSTKLTDLPMYREMLKENGIVRFRNLTTSPKKSPKSVVSYIVYEDGTIKEYLKDGTERKRAVV